MSHLTKVLVTGAAGHLGSHLVPELVKEGFKVTGLDVVAPSSPLPEGCRFLNMDLSDPVAVREALDGVELIVHCASIHPWKKYTDDQYLDCNIKCTWHLYTAAAELGINKIVLTSSIVAGGLAGIPVADWPIKEETQYSIGDLYSFTKHAQEDIARLHADRGIQTIALRPPAFMPKPEMETGFCLTGAYAVVSDVAAPHVAAARVLAGKQQPSEPLRPFEAFFITNSLPYTGEDGASVEADRNIKPLIKKYWPTAYDGLIEQGYQGAWVPAVFDLTKAQRLLNWRPAYNFEQWFAEHSK